MRSILYNNVGKTIINHPPKISIFIGGKNHSKMGGLLIYPGFISYSLQFSHKASAHPGSSKYESWPTKVGPPDSSSCILDIQLITGFSCDLRHLENAKSDAKFAHIQSSKKKHPYRIIKYHKFIYIHIHSIKNGGKVSHSLSNLGPT